MKANQVLIVMDREMLDVFLPVIGNTDYLESLSDRDLRKVSAAEDAMYDAIKRDPDELEARIARTLRLRRYPLLTGTGYPESVIQQSLEDARSVLHALAVSDE